MCEYIEPLQLLTDINYMSIRCLVTKKQIKTIVDGLVISGLYNCNCLFIGIGERQLNKFTAY